KATASNENVTVAFGIFPGNYSVALYENGKLIQIPEGNPQKIEIPDTTAVIFTLERGRIISVPFDVFILSPKNVKEGSFFMAEIDIQLPKEANETVEIKYIGSISISSDLPQGQLDYECDSYSGFSISPGERKTVIICSISVGNKGGGGSKGITISVPQEIIVGESDSGNIYFNKPASKTIRVT
ncbi:MAG: hypothetical protein QW692_05895, partial [Nitrososphaerota archaeon]